MTRAEWKRKHLTYHPARSNRYPSMRRRQVA